MLVLASSYSSIGWLSHFFMLNHNLNIILKLSSKKKRADCLYILGCVLVGERTAGILRPLLALIIHYNFHTCVHQSLC